MPSTDHPASDAGQLCRAEFAGPLREKDQIQIASGAFYLCQHSRLHATYPAEMVDRRIGPSLELGQFRYYTDSDGVPLAFCNWVWLSTPVLEDVLTTCRDLEPDEFNCGDLPFFYEFLAPFGHCRAVVRDLRGLPIFSGKRVPAIRARVTEQSTYDAQARYFAM